METVNIQFVGPSTLAAFLWRDTWQSAILVLLVWSALRLYGHCPAAARCAIWWIVCMKIVISLVISLPAIQLPVLPNVIAESSLQHESQAHTVPDLVPDRNLAVATKQTYAAAPQPRHGHPVAAKPANQNLAMLLGIPAWAIGVAICLFLLFLQFIRAHLLGRSAQLAPPGRLWSAVRAASQIMSVARAPLVYLSLLTASPMTIGLWRPRILLPGSDALCLSDSEVELALAHECAHIHRLDLWMGLVPAAAQVLFFFNPLVWLARREYLIAREEACDAMVLDKLAVPAYDYGKLLLKVAIPGAGGEASVAMSGAKSAEGLRRRLQALQTASRSRRTPGTWKLVLVMLLIAAALPVQLTHVEADSRPKTLPAAVNVADSAVPAPEASPVPAVVPDPQLAPSPQAPALAPAPEAAPSPGASGNANVADQQQEIADLKRQLAEEKAELARTRARKVELYLNGQAPDLNKLHKELNNCPNLTHEKGVYKLRILDKDGVETVRPSATDEYGLDKIKAEVDTPEFQKSIAELNAESSQLKSKEFAQSMADLGEKIGAEVGLSVGNAIKGLDTPAAEEKIRTQALQAATDTIREQLRTTSDPEERKALQHALDEVRSEE